MKKLPTPMTAGEPTAPADYRQHRRTVSLAERVARLAWMECAEGATRRDLAASVLSTPVTDPTEEVD
jgi:hypothetical protein